MYNRQILVSYLNKGLVNVEKCHMIALQHSKFALLFVLLKKSLNVRKNILLYLVSMLAYLYKRSDSILKKKHKKP